MDNRIARSNHLKIDHSHFSPYDFPTTGSNPPKLMDYDDTHVLDFNPNLKTLCVMAVIENNLDMYGLPQAIRQVIAAFDVGDVVSLLSLRFDSLAGGKFDQ